MSDISLDIAHAKLYKKEDLGTIKIKLFDASMKVLYSCLLYLEIYRVCNFPSM